MFFPFVIRFSESISTNRTSESIFTIINNSIEHERHYSSNPKSIIDGNILIFVNRLMTYDPFHAIEKGEFKLVPNPGSIILTYEFFMYRCLLIYIFVGSALIAVFSKPENR